MKKFLNDRYAKTFLRLKGKSRIGFCPFAVLGDPTSKKCLKRIEKYLEAKPDSLELGIPFSDPIADGSVIQAADERALKAGSTPKTAINLIKKIRTMTDIPIGILVYSNIIIRYGAPKFYKDLKKAGADSILIADVPLEEIKPFAKCAKRYNLHQIFLVSEYTDDVRLKKIEKIGSGFLYIVSALGVTGARKHLQSSTLKLIKKLKRKTKMPLVVGFGISKRKHIKTLQCAGANGAIVGSYLVKTPTKKLASNISSLQDISDHAIFGLTLCG